MITVYGLKHKGSARPRKSGARKRRRILEHRNRVIALGLSPEAARRANTKELRDLLRSPKATAAKLAKA